MIQAATLSELIEKASAAYAERPAYIWRPGLRALRFTYGEVGIMARRAAALLEQQGVQRGDRVVIWAANSPYWVAAFFGCQLKGAVAVPMMVQNTPEFVAKIVEVTGAKLVLKSATRKIEGLSARVIDVEPALAAMEGSSSFKAENPQPDDPCQILFTSGTTGTPKGVVIKHRNILANVKDVAAVGAFKPDDHLMSILPLSHSFEQVASLFTAMALGIPVTQAAALSGPHVRLNMVEDRPTILVAVPEFMRLVMMQIESKAEEQGNKAKLEFLFRQGPHLPVPVRRFLARAVLKRLGGRLRIIFAGGSALDPAVGARWEALGVAVRQGYGATECSPVLALSGEDDTDLSAVGKPLPSVSIRIADDGEILARGPNVVDGYYNRPEETAERFQDGWYHTDDLGSFDQNGRLHVKGRKKFLIVTPAGENVYPEDLEAELNKEPEVKDCAVLGWKHDNRFEIHAVILPRPGVTISRPEAVVERANQRLQPHQRMQGASLWDGEDFPRTPTRKIKKAEVQTWLENREQPKDSAVAGVVVGAVEACIARAVNMPPDRIRPEMRVEADLKLDSLGRVTLVGILEEDLGLVVDESQIGPETTVANIKEIVNRREQPKEQYGFREWPLSPTAQLIRNSGRMLVFWPYLRWLSRIEVIGADRIAAIKGPVLFCPNHLSPIDAAVVMLALPDRYQRKTAVAAATDVLYEHPSFKPVAPIADLFLNTYPFDRLHEVKSSLQYTGRLLDRGFSVMLFPEGHISTDNKIQEIKGGAGLIASEMGAPVVPVGLYGPDTLVSSDTRKLILPRRGKVRVVFGQPLSFTPGSDYRAASRRLYDAIDQARLEAAAAV